MNGGTLAYIISMKLIMKYFIYPFSLMRSDIGNYFELSEEVIASYCKLPLQDSNVLNTKHLRA